ncbi:MAG: S8 family serine peptidase, partial [Planctomycetota bacterium]
MQSSILREASLLRSAGLTAIFIAGLAPSLAWAQDLGSTEEPGGSKPLPAVSAISIAGAEALERKPERRPGIDGGTPFIREASKYDPELPRPIPRSFQPGAEGDTLLSEESGDPYFLNFASGKFHPAPGERVDPRLAERLIGGFDDDRPAEVTYAYVILDQRISPKTIEALEETGARVLGFHPHQAVTVALDLASLSLLSEHPAVRWLGYADTEHKLGRGLLEVLAAAESGERVPLYVSVFEDDRNPDTIREAGPKGLSNTGLELEQDATLGGRVQSRGWQQRLIEQAGGVVRYYEPDVQTFRVDADLEQIMRLVELDCVITVEPALPASSLHDDSLPMVSADITRSLTAGGQGTIPIGVIDSGFDIAHEALDWGLYVGWDVSGSVNPNPFVDVCTGHGTHVLGTVLGRPEPAEDDFSGVVPLIGSTADTAVRLARVGKPSDCSVLHFANGYGATFALFHFPTLNGTELIPPAEVINNSYGVVACSGSTAGSCWNYVGTETAARDVDAEVYNFGTSMVFAAGNDGELGAGTITQEGGAKNSIAVGAVAKGVFWDDAAPGEETIALPGRRQPFSSQGPMADGRWKPNVMAPGTNIMSAAFGTGDGYRYESGTSMAAPHVTGVIAQVLERNEFLRDAPHRIASLLMATANTKGDVLLTNPLDSHLDQFGAGRVDGYRAYENSADSTWTNWGFDLLPHEEAFEDFVVPAGTERLVVVMHYIEPPATSGAGQALINDFDLVIDRAPFSTEIDEGDYFFQQSAVDNTEIRHLLDPKEGPWRWKVHPNSASTPVRMSVTVHMLMGDQTPAGTLAVTAEDIYVKPNESVEVDATLSTGTGMLSVAWLSAYANVVGFGSLLVDVLEGTFFLADGIEADATDNFGTYDGLVVVAGNVHPGHPRTARWKLRWPFEGTKSWEVIARSDNGADLTTSVDIVVDGTPPGLPTALKSTSHTPGVWSSDPSVDFTWSAPFDNLSGVGGYGLFDNTIPGNPAAIMDIEAVTAHTTTFNSSQSGWYFNLRPVDRSGNWSTSSVSDGPYLIDAIAPGAVQSLIAPNDSTGVWLDDNDVDFKWFAAPDTHSGISGYGVDISFGGPSMPEKVQDIGAVESTTVSLPTVGSSWYVNFRAVDVAGNWSSSSVAMGPFKVDFAPPSINSIELAEDGQVVSETSNPLMDVIVSATDLSSGVESVRLKNTGGVFSPWMPFSSTIEWDLLAEGGLNLPGTRLVTVEIRDNAGHTATSSVAVDYYPHQIFGTACSGSLGMPTIAAGGSVRTGQSVTIEVGNSAAATKSLYAGFSNSTWQGLALPLDLAMVGSPGCSVDAALDFPLSGGSDASVSVAIPDS